MSADLVLIFTRLILSFSRPADHNNNPIYYDVCTYIKRFPELNNVWLNKKPEKHSICFIDAYVIFDLLYCHKGGPWAHAMITTMQIVLTTMHLPHLYIIVNGSHSDHFRSWKIWIPHRIMTEFELVCSFYFFMALYMQKKSVIK